VDFITAPLLFGIRLETGNNKTMYFPNSSVERCRFTSLFGERNAEVRLSLQLADLTLITGLKIFC
jgi:hypothetical protein